VTEADAILAALDAYGPVLSLVPETEAMQKLPGILKLLQDARISYRTLQMLSEFEEMSPLDFRASLRMPPMQISGTAVVTPPHPADLVQTPQAAKLSHAQLRTLLIGLVWLLAIIVPIVQQRLSAEAQMVTDAEVGTLSLALAITVLMNARK
jgi:hypothetical protein